MFFYFCDVFDKGKKSKRITLKFSVDCSVPVEDEIMDVSSFVSFLLCVAWSLLNLADDFRIRVAFPNPSMLFLFVYRSSF